MVKVVWTDSAIYDLRDIGDYIKKDSERYAELTVERLFNAVEILEEHPRSGKIVPEFENENIRELIRMNFRIVYHIIDAYRVDIITVHRCERLLGSAYSFSDFDND